MVPVSAKEGRRPRSLRGGRGHRSPVRKSRLSPTIALVPTRHCNGALATADDGTDCCCKRAAERRSLSRPCRLSKYLAGLTCSDQSMAQRLRGSA